MNEQQEREFDEKVSSGEWIIGTTLDGDYEEVVWDAVIAFVSRLMEEARGEVFQQVLKVRKGLKREYSVNGKSNDYVDGYNNGLYDFAKEVRSLEAARNKN